MVNEIEKDILLRTNNIINKVFEKSLSIDEAKEVILLANEISSGCYRKIEELCTHENFLETISDDIIHCHTCNNQVKFNGTRLEIVTGI